jgi:hypothetical protein
MQNITELRTSLADNYTRMKAGKMGLNVGKELANTAGKIINSLKVELEYNSMMSIKEEIDFLKKAPKQDESKT